MVVKLNIKHDVMTTVSCKKKIEREYVVLYSNED